MPEVLAPPQLLRDTLFPSGEWLYSLSKSHESFPHSANLKGGNRVGHHWFPQNECHVQPSMVLLVPITGVWGFQINRKNSPEGDFPPWAKIGWVVPIGQGRKGADRSGLLLHSSSPSFPDFHPSLFPLTWHRSLFLLYLTPFWGLGLSLGLADTREQHNSASV